MTRTTASVCRSWPRLVGCMCGHRWISVWQYGHWENCPACGRNAYRQGKYQKPTPAQICRECNQKRSHMWHGAEIAKKEAELLRQIKTLLNEAT